MDCLCSFVNFLNIFVFIQKVWSGGTSTRIVLRPFWDFQRDRHLLLIWSFEEWYFYSLEFFVHFLFIYFGKPSKNKRFLKFFHLGIILRLMRTVRIASPMMSDEDLFIYICVCVWMCVWGCTHAKIFLGCIKFPGSSLGARANTHKLKRD